MILLKKRNIKKAVAAVLAAVSIWSMILPCQGAIAAEAQASSKFLDLSASSTDIDEKFVADLPGNDEATDWGIQVTGADIAKNAIQNSAGDYDEIVIGVLDSGINYNHELFEGRIVDTTFNMSGYGDDDDCMDYYGHGTAVAGIIAQTTPDNVKIMPYKVVGDDGTCTLSAMTAAIEKILASNNKPDILNLSIDAYDPYGELGIMNDLVDKLSAAGITVCVSAGNNNAPASFNVPASAENAITVGAVYVSRLSEYGSCYGSEIDVAAPGDRIPTAGIGSSSEYVTLSGTSASCPFVSAACAYILMQNKDLEPAEVEDIIKDRAVYMGEDEEPYCGSGMINFPNLIGSAEYETPMPSVAGGYYSNTQSVSFDNIPAGTQLIYVLGDYMPTSENCTVYTEPITISNETILSYALINTKTKKYASNIVSQYYTVQHIADESELIITDDGEITGYTGSANNIIIPDTVNGITPVKIGKNAYNEGAFQGSSLTAIELPDSITEIGSFAFSGSEYLKHISGVNVKRIGSDAFSSCYELRDADLPNTSEIGSHAFNGCERLHYVNFSQSCTEIPSYAFENSGIIYADFANVKKIGRYAFDNSSLIKGNFPKTTEIDDYAFSECENLTELNISAIEILDGRNFIGDCYNLDSIDLPNVTEVGDGAFANSYIDTLYLPECEYLSGTIAEYSYIRVMDLPKLKGADDTHPIEKEAFHNCNVEEIYLDSLEDMSEGAFENLPALKVLYLPELKLLPGRLILSNTYDASSLEILWTPKADFNNSYAITLADSLKLFNAASATHINISSYCANIILSEKAEDIKIAPASGSYQNNTFPTVIAPEGSAAHQYAVDSENLNYINSDNIINSRGGQIRLRDFGLRLGFTLDEDKFDFLDSVNGYQRLAGRINAKKEYGFVYTHNTVSDDLSQANAELRIGADGSASIEAEKTQLEGSLLTYNLVFTNIPRAAHEEKVSGRAYLYVDGMYFYSPVNTRSYNQVANAILADDAIDEYTKQLVRESM